MKKILIVSIAILTIIFSFLLFNLIKNNTNLLNSSSEKLNIESDLVKNLYLNVNPSEDANVLIEMYENETLSNKYILAIGISHYLNNKINDKSEAPKYISKQDIEDSIHQILGYNVSFDHEDTYLLNDKACGYFYKQEIEKYKIIPGCGGNSNEKFYRKIVSAEKKNDLILITEKLIYMYNDWDEYINKVFIYDSYNKQKSLDYFEKDASENINIDLNTYIDQASTYVYTFKIKNENYIFDSIKKI